jgi:hypothetical protein
MGQYFMEPGDYHDYPMRKVLGLIRNAGVIEGSTGTGSSVERVRGSASAGRILVIPLQSGSVECSNLSDHYIANKKQL